MPDLLVRWFYLLQRESWRESRVREWARTEIVVTVVTKVSPRAHFAGETADLRQEQHRHAIIQRNREGLDINGVGTVLSNSKHCALQCIGHPLLPNV